MQEKEKQGANPVENKVLLYSGKPRVSEDREGLAGTFRRTTLFQVFAELADVSSFGIAEMFLSYLQGLVPLGWAMVSAQFQVPAHSCLTPPAQDTHCLGSGL